MKNKGVSWLLLFSLIIVFVLTDTLDLSLFTSRFEVHSFDPSGFSADVTDKPLMIYDGLPSDVVLYKSFQIGGFSDRYSLRFSVPNNWLRKNRVRSRDVLLFAETPSGWSQVPLGYSVYSDDTEYSAKELTGDLEGVFVVAGRQSDFYEEATSLGFAPKLGIFILILLFLFFLIYHRVSSREARRSRQDANLERLERYLRKSLLAGNPDSELRKALISAGWDSEVVNQALRRVRFF